MNHKRPPQDGYTQVKTGMRRFGPAMIAIGGLMLIIGVGQFFLTFISAATSEPFSSEQPSFPILFIILGIPGMLILSIGLTLTKVGYLKEIAQYGAKETVPAVQTTTTAIRSAILDDDIPCPKCSQPIEPNSKFCASCGVLVGSLKCPNCNNPIESDDRFCNDCGTQVNLPQNA